MNYTDKFPTSMKTGGMKKAQKGGPAKKKKAIPLPHKFKKVPGNPYVTMPHKFKKVPKSEALQNLKKGGFPDLTGDGKVTRADVLKGRGVFKSGGSKGLPKKQLGGVMRAIEKKPLPKIGGRTTTGVVNDYQGYKAPVSKKQMHLLKKQKGGGFPEEYLREINKTGVPGSKEYDDYLKKQGKPAIGPGFKKPKMKPKSSPPMPNKQMGGDFSKPKYKSFNLVNVQKRREKFAKMKKKSIRNSYK